MRLELSRSAKCHELKTKRFAYAAMEFCHDEKTNLGRGP